MQQPKRDERNRYQPLPSGPARRAPSPAIDTRRATTRPQAVLKSQVTTKTVMDGHLGFPAPAMGPQRCRMPRSGGEASLLHTARHILTPWPMLAPSTRTSSRPCSTAEGRRNRSVLHSTTGKPSSAAEGQGASTQPRSPSRCALQVLQHVASVAVRAQCGLLAAPRIWQRRDWLRAARGPWLTLDSRCICTVRVPGRPRRRRCRALGRPRGAVVVGALRRHVPPRGRAADAPCAARRAGAARGAV